MTARAFTLPAETSIVLARKNSGEAHVGDSLEIHPHSFRRLSAHESGK
jgi:hypothetical protein